MTNHPTYLALKSKSPEEKARIKEIENITRFETHAILKGIQPDEYMRERVREACIAFYLAHPEEITVPSDILVESGLGSLKGVELNV